MRKLIFNLHLYGALIAGLFVVVIGVTGSIMAFEDDLERLTHPALYHVEPQGTAMPVADLLKAALRAYPGAKIGSMRLPQGPSDSAAFSVKGRQVFINPYTGAIVGERNGTTFLGNVHQLHLRLMMTGASAKVGSNIVAGATAVLLFLVISGDYLWWPVKRATVNWAASARRIHFDLHNTAGIYSFVPAGARDNRHSDTLRQRPETYLHERAGTHKIGRNTPSFRRPE